MKPGPGTDLPKVLMRRAELGWQEGPSPLLLVQQILDSSLEVSSRDSGHARPLLPDPSFACFAGRDPLLNELRCTTESHGSSSKIPLHHR